MKLKDVLLSALVGALSALLVAGAAGLVNESARLGAGSRFPNGISADTTAPSAAGQIRGTTLVITGAATLANVDSSGEIEGSIVEEGSVTTVTINGGTSTLTAANICDSNVLKLEYSLILASSTLPTTANLIADCLDDQGDAISLLLHNSSTTSELTVKAGDASTTLLGSYDASSTEDVLAAGDRAVLKLLRTGVTTVDAVLLRLGNAD